MDKISTQLNVAVCLHQASSDGLLRIQYICKEQRPPSLFLLLENGTGHVRFWTIKCYRILMKPLKKHWYNYWDIIRWTSLIPEVNSGPYSSEIHKVQTSIHIVQNQTSAKTVPTVHGHRIIKWKILTTGIWRYTYSDVIGHYVLQPNTQNGNSGELEDNIFNCFITPCLW